MTNPFFHRGPIRDRVYFFGREHETSQAGFHAFELQQGARPAKSVWAGDMDGDGRPEIVVLALGTVYAFSGDGQQIWQQPEESGLQSGLLDSPAGKLITCAVDSQSPAAILMTIPEQGAAYLLIPDGQRLAEYRSGETTKYLTRDTRPLQHPDHALVSLLRPAGRAGSADFAGSGVGPGALSPPAGLPAFACRSG